MIYMDNAATTIKKPEEVIERVGLAMNSLGNAGRGATTGALDAARIIYDTREKLAKLFGVSMPKNIAFTSNSTESLNLAIHGLFQKGDHVITTMMEHNSVLRPLYLLEEQGVIELSVVPCDRNGNFEIEDLFDDVRAHTKGIVCTHASNLTGNVVDIKKIGGKAKEMGLAFVVDASQTAGVFPIDVEEMNIDILCFTGHKGLLGPQGTGGIYVKDGIKLLPLMVGGTGVDTYNKHHPMEMPTVLEAGTLNGHGIAGLNGALSYLERVSIASIRTREQALMKQFYNGVKSIEGIQVYGDFTDENRCAIVALNIRDYDSSEVSDELLMSYDISTRPGAHCAPLMHEALGTVDQGAVRFSFSHYNTEDEINIAIEAIKKLSKEE